MGMCVAVFWDSSKQHKSELLIALVFFGILNGIVLQKAKKLKDKGEPVSEN
jgi:hypothetical protein